MEDNRQTFAEVIASPFFFSVQLIYTERGIAAVSFVEKQEEQRCSHPWRFVTDRVIDYLRGDNPDLHIPLVLPELPPFTERVLARCLKIPHGQTVTYGEIAASAGNARAARAAGNALRRNPIPIIIPCHRVIAGDGELHGFMGREGVAIKRCLLELEKIPLR